MHYDCSFIRNHFHYSINKVELLPLIKQFTKKKSLFSEKKEKNVYLLKKRIEYMIYE